MLTRFNKINCFLWNTKNTDRNGINEQNHFYPSIPFIRKFYTSSPFLGRFWKLSSPITKAGEEGRGGGGGGSSGLLKSQFVRRKLHAANIFSLNFANKTFWNELLLARMSKSAQKNWQNREKSHWIKRSFDVMDLIHIRIYFNISNYKVNSKQSAFHSLKGSEIHYLLNAICWMVA